MNVFTVTEAQILAWITPVIWPFLRVLALLGTLPVIGQRTVPARARVALAFLIAVCAQASLPPIPPIPLDSAVTFLVVLQQIVIGVSLGFAVRIVFAAVEFAGELIGLQMGLNFAGFFDPISASQATASSRFFGTTIAWLFIVINGHLIVIAALVQSFQAFPVGPEPFAFLRAMQPQTWGAEIFGLGLWIALPMVAMLTFVNLVLAAFNLVPAFLGVPLSVFVITTFVGIIPATVIFATSYGYLDYAIALGKKYPKVSFMHAGGLPPRSDYGPGSLSSEGPGLHRFFTKSTGDPSGSGGERDDAVPDRADVVPARGSPMSSTAGTHPDRHAWSRRMRVVALSAGALAVLAAAGGLAALNGYDDRADEGDHRPWWDGHVTHRCRPVSPSFCSFSREGTTVARSWKMIEALTHALQQPGRPMIAIVAGSKVSTKLTILNNLAERVDQLIVGGGIANTFLLAQGLPIGKSLAEPDLLADAKAVIAAMKARGAAVPIPVDVVVAKAFKADAIALRRWDDEGKIVGAATPGLAHFEQPAFAWR